MIVLWVCVAAVAAVVMVGWAINKADIELEAWADEQNADLDRKDNDGKKTQP